MKRMIDMLAVIFVIPLALPIAVAVAVAVQLTSKGPILYWSTRVGRENKRFQMPKFRTMRVGTPQVATHLLDGAEDALTPIGSALRASSLDEIPQLWSVLVGHLSVVGPRPALFNQADLIELRERHKINTLRPGITGWAQVNGRDSISIEEKVRYDKEYLEKTSLMFDLKIVLLTIKKVIARSDIAH